MMPSETNPQAEVLNSNSTKKQIDINRQKLSERHRNTT